MYVKKQSAFFDRGTVPSLCFSVTQHFKQLVENCVRTSWQNVASYLGMIISSHLEGVALCFSSQYPIPSQGRFFSLNHPAPLETSFYNLGQNNIRNKSTPPPKSMMNSLYNQNAPFFPPLKWGEEWTKFFTCFVQDCSFIHFFKYFWFWNPPPTLCYKKSSKASVCVGY